jgi:polyferredoxin
MVRTTRIISQIFFFVLFTVLLFAFNRNPWVHDCPTEMFLQINPLLFLLTSLSSRAIIYALLPGALIIAILSVFTGRTFCGFICPLGAAIDFSDRFITKKARSTSARPRITLQKLKYILLFIFVILAVFGILAPCFVDPISITTRIMTSIVEPAIRSLTYSISHLFIQATNIFTDNKKELPVIKVAVSGTLPALLLFTFIFAAGIIDRRFWCHICMPYRCIPWAAGEVFLFSPTCQ